LALAYASGFAVGNGVGLAVERGLSRGAAVIRILSGDRGDTIAQRLRRDGHRVAAFEGSRGDGRSTMLVVVAPRRLSRTVIAAAREIDPELVYVSEPAHETGGGVQLRLRPVPQPTGWRSVLKKK
jgi:uncharacterized protein YebE (UPF0316 family)